MYYEPIISVKAREPAQFARGILTGALLSLLLWAVIVAACIRII
jgi:hypothetical protein